MGARIHRLLPLRFRRRPPCLSHRPLPYSPSLLYLSPSPTAVTPQPLPLHLLLHFRLRPSTPVTKTEGRRRPLLPLHPTAAAPFPLPPSVTKTSSPLPPFLCPLRSPKPHRRRPLSSAPFGRRNLTAVAPFPLPPPVARSHRPDALPLRLLPHAATLLLPFPVAMASFFIAGTAVFLPDKAMTRSPYLRPRLSIGALLSPSFRPSPPTSPLSGFLSATVIVSPCQPW